MLFLPKNADVLQKLLTSAKYVGKHVANNKSKQSQRKSMSLFRKDYKTEKVIAAMISISHTKVKAMNNYQSRGTLKELDHSYMI